MERHGDHTTRGNSGTFNFKADGAMLTGSTLGFDGAEVPIKDGKIDGNNISFTVTFDFGGMPFVLSYKACWPLPRNSRLRPMLSECLSSLR